MDRTADDQTALAPDGEGPMVVSDVAHAGESPFAAFSKCFDDGWLEILPPYISRA
jgi:hypothetical protein